MNFIKKSILSLVFLAGISLGASSAKAACSTHLGDFDWDSANIHTAIASFVIENGYGCDVEVTKGSTTPIWQHSLMDKLMSLLNYGKIT